MIRPAAANEASVLTNLALDAKRYWGYPEHWIKHWQSDLTISSDFILDNHVYVAEEDGKILGFYALIVNGNQAELDHMWVTPDCIGTGIGKALFLDAMERAAELATSAGKNVIGVDDLPDWFGRRPSTRPPPSIKPSDVPPGMRRSPRAAPTKEELQALLEQNDWIVARVARALDRDHAVVWRWIKRYGIEVADPSESDS